MIPAIYNVVSRGGCWRMVVNHSEFGSFATEGQAVRTAIETAYAAGRIGGAGAVVLLHDSSEIARVVWTYDTDPFPPTRFG